MDVIFPFWLQEVEGFASHTKEISGQLDDFSAQLGQLQLPQSASEVENFLTAQVFVS